MTKSRVLWSVAGALLVAVGIWIATHTYWADATIPMPLKGEARTNPFYAAQRLTSALGARPVRDRTFVVPPADGVLVLSEWHWSLVRDRRQAIERWVESGGRLVVDSLLVTTNQDFEHWAGIDRAVDEESSDAPTRYSACRTFTEETADTPRRGKSRTKLSLCGAQHLWSLKTKKPVEWSLRDSTGIQAVRVRVGQGHVTWINAEPFRYQELFQGDHGWLFVAATDLRRGDDVHFLSEADVPPLLVLMWRWGAPVVIVALLIVALLLWRGAVRFGPIAPTASAERRSLAEQIRGTGHFASRHGGGEALHAATVRALEEAARRRVPGYNALPASERGVALQRLTSVDATDLLTAAYHQRSTRPNQLRAAIALLENARRHIVVTLTRSAYGKH